MQKLTEETVQKLQRSGIAVWAVLGIIALAIGLFLLIAHLRQIFALFFYTIAIVYILSPLVDFIESKGVPRLAAVAITYLAVMLLITLLLLYLIPIIISQGVQFVEKFPGNLESEIEFLQTWKGRLIELRVPPSAVRLLEQLLDQLRASGLALLSSVPGVTLNVFSVVFYLILAPVLAFYLLKDLDKVRQTMIDLIPAAYRTTAIEILEKVDQVLSGFLRGQFLVALSLGVLTSIIFTVIGIDFSIVLGMLVGILNIIPYFGPIMGGLIAVVVAFFKAPILALWVILAMFAVSIVDATLISPGIMGQQVDLHPVLVAFAILIGGALLGLLGVFIAIPVAAVGKVIVYYFTQRADEIQAIAEYEGEAK